MNKNSPLYKWLQKQPKEFIANVSDNDLLGNGQFTIDDLIELDSIFNNPEDKENV